MNELLGSSQMSDIVHCHTLSHSHSLLCLVCKLPGICMALSRNKSISLSAYSVIYYAKIQHQ